MKYRIMKITRGIGSVVYMPQQRLLFCWSDMALEYKDSLSEAEKFIENFVHYRKLHTVLKKEVINYEV